MYEQYWQLETKPFENTSASRFYYPGEAHQGALLKLRYAIENQRGAALLTGVTGLGKTLLAQSLAQQLPERFEPCVHIVFPAMPPEQLLAYIADELTNESPQASTPPPTIEQSVRRIENMLAENTAHNRHAVVMIDEAHLLTDYNSLETMRLLLNFEHAGKSSLTLLFIGQPSLLPVLDRTPQLDARMGVKCLMRPFTMEETTGYIAHRLSAASAQREIFTDDAMEAIHETTGGSPRYINRLCDLALLIGFAEEQDKIDAHQIESVGHELTTVAPE